MMTLDLMDYLSSPEKVGMEKVAEIDDALSRLEMHSLGVERNAYQTIKKRLLDEKVNILFPKLNLSFLEMKHKKYHDLCTHTSGQYQTGKGKVHSRVSLPRFAVYPLESSVFGVDLAFVIPYGYTPDRFSEVKGFFKKEDIRFFADLYVGCLTPELKRLSETSRNLHPMLKKQISNSFSIEYLNYVNSEGNSYFHYNDRSDKNTFKAFFSPLFLIPQETKTVIDKNKHLFGDSMYVITEVDEWSILHIDGERIAKKKCNDDLAECVLASIKEENKNRDPLLVGLRGEHCYLLTAFNCTPLENYIKSEFTGG